MTHKMPEKIVVLYLIYGASAIASGQQKFEEILGRMFPQVPVDVYVVDNSITDSVLLDGELILPGDNSFREFSGWDAGLKLLLNSKDYDDTTLCLFVNDTFHRTYYKTGTDFLDVFDADLIANKDVMNSAIGYLDDFPREVSICGVRFQSWIRSNIFFLPLRVVRKLYPFTFSLDDKELFNNDIDKFWRADAPMSENWKAYISSWMFGEVNADFLEYQLHWKGAQPVTPDNLLMFRKKARCILSEHWLTARLYQNKIPVIDTNIYDRSPDRHVTDYYLKDGLTT